MSLQQTLVESGETYLYTLTAEFALTDKLRRIFSLSKQIARPLAPEDV